MPARLQLRYSDNIAKGQRREIPSDCLLLLLGYWNETNETLALRSSRTKLIKWVIVCFLHRLSNRFVFEREGAIMSQISVDVNIEVRFPRERKQEQHYSVVLDLHYSIARLRAPMEMALSFLIVWKGFHSENDFLCVDTTSSRVWSMTAVRGQPTITFKIDLKT